MAQPSHVDFDAALRRARIKQSVVALLEPLAPADRLNVLADLLTEMGSMSTTSGASASRAETKEEAVSLDADPGESYRDAVLAALKEKPRRPVSELAEAAYGEANDVTIGRVRAILTALKKRGLVHNPSFGKWVVKKRKEAVDS